MTRASTILAIILSAPACSGTDVSGSGAIRARVAEVEVTHQAGGTTTIERHDLTYVGDSGRLKEMTEVRNGTTSGRVELAYSGDLVTRIVTTSAAGHRRETTLRYDGEGRVESLLEVEPGPVTTTIDLRYDEGRLSQVTRTEAGAAESGAATLYSDVDYDDEGRIERVTDIRGADTSSYELRYDADGRIERITRYDAGQISKSWRLAHDDEGRLAEMTSDDHDRVDLAYADGLVEEIRVLDASSASTTSYHYRYVDGDTVGLTFAPDLPYSPLFDLAGHALDRLDPLHFSVQSWSTDVSAPAASDQPSEAACTECLDGSCRSQWDACLADSSCQAYVQCLDGCTTASCDSGCASSYSWGKRVFDDYVDCAVAWCATPCEL